MSGLDKIAERLIIGFGAGVTADGSAILNGGAHNLFVDMMLYFGVIPGIFVCASLIVIPLTFFTWHSVDPDIKLMASAIGFTMLCQWLIFQSEMSFGASILRVLLYYFTGTAVALLRAMSVERQTVLPHGMPEGSSLHA